MSCANGPARVNITVYRGQDYREAFIFTESDGTARDFTGCTVTGFIRDEAGDAADLSLSETATANGSILTVTDNEVEVYINDADITALPGSGEDTGEFVWSLWVEEPGGDDAPELTGALTVVPAV